MSDQLSLLDLAPIGRSRRTDPITSVLAAQRPRAGIMALVVQALKANPRGLTDSELLAECSLPEHKRGSVVRRRADAGAVATGLTRPSPSGHPMIVWKLP